MAGYLARVAAGAMPTPAKGRMRPVFRSQSPIAEMDQRIGLNGFDSLTGDGSFPADAEFESPSLDDAVDSAFPAVLAGQPLVQRQVSQAIPAGGLLPDVSPLVPMPPTRDMPVRHDVSQDPPAADAQQVVSVSGTPMSIETSGQFHSPEGGTPPMSEPPQELSNPMEPTFSETSFRPDRMRRSGLSRVAPAMDVRLDPDIAQNPDRDEPARFTEAAPTILPVTPDPALPPPPLEPIEADEQEPETQSVTEQKEQPVTLKPAMATRMSEPTEPTSLRDAISPPAEAAPRVVIGRINVEVIPPASTLQVPQTSTPSAPVTAASVSKIGPLHPALRSNLRFSFRQR